jgi:hypothetical protein
MKNDTRTVDFAWSGGCRSGDHDVFYFLLPCRMWVRTTIQPSPWRYGHAVERHDADGRHRQSAATHKRYFDRKLIALAAGGACGRFLAEERYRANRSCPIVAHRPAGCPGV